MAVNFQRCPICNRWEWFPGHKCLNSWAVFLDLDEEPERIFADSAEDAAVCYAGEHDAGDYHVAHGADLTVWVCLWSEWEDSLEDSEGTLNHQKFIVAGYLEPAYRATRAEVTT